MNSLLVDGVIAGVGAVIVFLPQILLLFLFIGFLEDTGYMARAAFLMDRLMSKVGLHGKSFIPMLSSFACAIPGIMATRTIESPKDRLVTILVAPLMSCSARLPVYTLLIAACIPNITVLGFLKLPGLTMLAMYLLGIVVALLMAWLFKKTLLKGETPMLIMELPPYKRPFCKSWFAICGTARGCSCAGPARSFWASISCSGSWPPIPAARDATRSAAHSEAQLQAQLAQAGCAGANRSRSHGTRRPR